MAAAAAIKLPAKVSKGLTDENVSTIVAFLTALRDEELTPEAILHVGEHIADYADKLDEAERAEAEAAKKAEAAKRKAEKAAGASRLPAAPKKKSESAEEDADNKPIKLVEGRHYIANSIPRLKGLVLEFTGKYVSDTAAKNAGDAKLRVLSDGDLKGKLVPVPVSMLKATTKKVAAAKSESKSETTEKVIEAATPSDAMGLLLPPFARSLRVVR